MASRRGHKSYLISVYVVVVVVVGKLGFLGGEKNRHEGDFKRH